MARLFAPTLNLGRHPGFALGRTDPDCLRTNPGGNPPIPPTALQVHTAFNAVRTRYAERPTVAAKVIEAMQLLMHGIPLASVPSQMRCAGWPRGRKLWLILAELRLETRLNTNAAPAALGYCKMFCNGF